MFQAHQLAITGFAIFAAAAQPHAGAATFYVDDDAPGDPGPNNPLISNGAENGSAAAPFDRIQEAINAAATGDIIHVAAGAYFEFGTVNLGTKNLTLVGTAGAAQTIIDMINWSDQVMEITGGQNATTVVDGFTLTNGRALGGSPNDRGAGLYCNSSSPIVRNCVFRDNEAIAGAFYANLGSPQLFDCVFEDNAGQSGGAAYLNATTANFTNCTFVDNSATNFGGAIRQSTAAGLYTRCTFIGNTALNGGAMDMGGGASTGMTCRDCLFANNSASGVGGAVQLATPTNTVINWINCVFFDNAATGNGGAVHVAGRGDFTNCTFSANTTTGGGGGGAIHTVGTAIANARNCIAWGNSSNGFNSATSATYCNVQNAMAGAGNISSDPLFADPAKGDLRLQQGSPCIDSGNSTLVPVAVAADFDGLARVINALASGATGLPAYGYYVDMGAFEHQVMPEPPIDTCPADLAPDSGDGVVNVGDLLAVIRAWGACPK